LRFSAPERLTAAHDTSGFANGTHTELDDWLRKALERESSARTFVACASGTARVAGYYALSAASVERQGLQGAARRKGLPGRVPVVLLGRMAVDRSAVGKGLGGSLLTDACRRALSVTQDVAAYAVLVHAIDAAARAFYAKYGFVDMTGDSPFAMPMFLPMRSIRSA